MFLLLIPLFWLYEMARCMKFYLLLAFRKWIFTLKLQIVNFAHSATNPTILNLQLSI